MALQLRVTQQPLDLLKTLRGIVEIPMATGIESAWIHGVSTDGAKQYVKLGSAMVHVEEIRTYPQGQPVQSMEIIMILNDPLVERTLQAAPMRYSNYPSLVQLNIIDANGDLLTSKTMNIDRGGMISNLKFGFRAAPRFDSVGKRLEPVIAFPLTLVISRPAGCVLIQVPFEFNNVPMRLPRK